MTNHEILVIASRVSGFSIKELETNTHVLAFAHALLLAYDQKLMTEKLAYEKWISDLER